MQLAFGRSARGRIVLFVGLCVIAFGACSDHDPADSDTDTKDGGDGDSTTSGRGGSGGSGGRSGASGRGGAGGQSGTGGGGGAGGSTDVSGVYMCEPKPGDTGGSAENGADCCDGRGACSEAAGATPGLPHDTCRAEPDLRCVPKPSASGGDEDAGAPAGSVTCRVQFPGAPAQAPSFEGRCWPSCFVKGSPIVSRLSRATCAEGELCTPCYNPLTGDSTGACEHGSDSPLEPPLPGFTECSSGAGYCIPSFAAGGSASSLSQLTCAAGELCAPKLKVADPDACFRRCASALGPGACAPSFLAGAGSPFLTRGDCGEGELCIPCEALNSRTGVCD